MKCLILISLIFFSTCLFGQTAFKKNSIFLEVGGNGLFTSINYDRQITNKPGLGIRLGVGFYSTNPFQITIPIGINYLYEIKNNKSFMEFGLGTTWTRADVELYVLAEHRDPNYKNTHFINFIPSMGYRRHTKNFFMWRLSLTPVVNQYGFLPYFGISFGKLF